MRILITGNKGYIGSIMVPMMKKEGHEIIGLDSDLFEACTFSEPVPNIECITKDIRDIEASDLTSIDALVHLAALSNDPLSNFNPELTYDINYEASVNLAKLAKKVGVQRFLFSSTCSVYGSFTDTFLTENSEPRPLTPYATSKLLAERDISRLADSNFCPTFLRSATAFGVSPKHRFDLVLNNLVAWAYATGTVLLKSDGMAWRPTVHIEDISRAFIAVLNAPDHLINNQIFNVGVTKENYQIRKLADIVKETVLGSEVEYINDAGPDKRSYQVNFNKITKTLPQFQPQWNARQGALELYTAYQKAGITREDFEGPKYRRLKHLKKLLKSNLIDETLRWKIAT